MKTQMVRIDAAVLRRLRRFCKARGLVMTKVVSRVMADYIDRATIANDAASTSTDAVVTSELRTFDRLTQ